MTEASTTPSDAGPEKIWREALAAGEFRIQRCNACQRHIFFPRVLCNHCGAMDLAWVRPSGRGTVYSTSVVRRTAEAGGDLNVVLVDLDEGVRMMSRVEGLPPAQVTIGMAVQARIRQEPTRDGDKPLVVFDVIGLKPGSAA